MFLVSIPIYSKKRKELPRLIVTTDINIDSGDPDDRQSMIHLFFYANELDIRGIVIDRIDAGGIDATFQVLKCYEKDYNNPKYNFKALGYPSPEILKSKIFYSKEDAMKGIINEASLSQSPLYIAMWGQMDIVEKSLQKKPEIANNIRLLSIGTDLMAPTDTSVCGVKNWNNMGGTRDVIFNDSRFSKIWWVENNWGYNGMFTGVSPRKFLDEISNYGELGKHMKEVVKNHPWAQYFRAGDTPSIMYFINNNNLDDPTSNNLGGYFIKPFPENRPNYYVDSYPGSSWNYESPCLEWDKSKNELKLRAKEIEFRRNEMYTLFLKKLNELYKE